MNSVSIMQHDDRWRPKAFGAVALIGFAILCLDACSSGSPSSTNMSLNANNVSATPASPAATTEQSPPASLANAGEYGENIYDYAKANDWKNAEMKLAALNDAIKQVRAEINNQGAAVDRLGSDVVALDRALTARDRQVVMQQANQVTLDVANMTTAYKLSVPVEVTKLDYYGRELEVWAQAKDANKLQTTVGEIRRTWDALRPTIAAKGATEAKKFEALVAQAEAAKTPADYLRVATPILNEVDNLEKLFH